MKKHKKPFLCRIGIHKDTPFAFDIVGMSVVDYAQCTGCGRLTKTIFLPPLGPHKEKIKEEELPFYITLNSNTNERTTG